MKNKIILITTAIILALSVSLTSCSKKEVSETSASKPQSVAVFVPGIAADSPIYAMLVSGVQKAVDSTNANRKDNEKVQITVLEAGTNQAEWGTKLTALCAEMKYDVIISSNPSLPDLAEPLTAQFPSQKFIFLDATKTGNNNIATVCYNQHEQSYLTGYIAGLMSKSHKIGLIAAQEYPVMNKVIMPGFEEGAKAAYAGTEVDIRIVGNWYDASRGSELATAQHNAGVDVILPICGGASQGVISAAKEFGMYITWFDDNGFERAPGTVISSTAMEQELMAEEVTLEYLAGNTKWGTANAVGVREGYIKFVEDAPLYISTVPENIRAEMSKVISAIKDGTLLLPQEL